MKFFPWAVVRSARLAEIHQRSSSLDKENQILKETNRSLQNTVLIQEESIEEQKAKSSLVKVSERGNRIIQLETEVRMLNEIIKRRGEEEKVSGNGVQTTYPFLPGLLPDALVQSSFDFTPGNFEVVSKESAGFKNPPGQLLRSGETIESEGD